MQGIFNKLLGVHPLALNLQANRAEILASNLTNADTPNFKAQDIDFESLLRSQFGNSANNIDDVDLLKSNYQHINSSDLSANKLYRTPTQASLDGNTVETHIEKAQFMENALRYQVSTQLITGKFNGFIKALKGE